MKYPLLIAGLLLVLVSAFFVLDEGQEFSEEKPRIVSPLLQKTFVLESETVRIANPIASVAESPASSSPYIIKTGDWDENIREIGNIVFNEQTQEYIFYYSGHTGENQRGNNEIYVGAAASKDKVIWEKTGKVFEEYAEDPHVIYCKGSYWMFYEEKTRIPDNSISVARSENGRRFEVFAKDIIVPKEKSFQSRDTSSPVAVCTQAGAVVLYEARKNGVTGATLGYASSSDFRHWEQLSKPVYTISGEHFIVPQSIRKESGRFILTYADIAYFLNCKNTIWATQSLESTDLLRWKKSTRVQDKCGADMFFDAQTLLRRDDFGVYKVPL